ncbi:MAG: hypothetical protein ABJG78_18210 [Cyclobacteriaceae bacterium]
MKKMRILRLLMVSTFLPLISNGQEMVEKWQEKFQRPPTAYSIDSENNSYLGFENGSLQKFSSKGSEILSFSFPNQSSITQIEAQNNRKVFLFYRDIQQIVLLDRFSAVPKKYGLLDFGINYAESACINPDGTFWLAENNPRLLRKIDLLRNSVIHEVQHELGDNISIMRAFGNSLLVASENGLHVLDQFGNLNGTIKLDGITYLQSTNDEVLVTYAEGLVRIDPFKIEIIEEVTSEEFANSKAIMKFGSEYFVIDDQRIALYSLANQKK